MRDIVCGNYNDFPNIFIHGPTGSGKKTLINLILKDMFGDEIFDVRKEEYSIMLFGNKKETITLDQSNHHIIINPTNSAFDRYLVQDIVMRYCSQFTLDMIKNKNRFKVVIINNIDKLSYYAQTSLRCSMERYIHNCKFILCGYNMSKVIDPLKGRCLSIRLPKPKNIDIYKLLLNVSARENKLLSRSDYNDIINKCSRNPKLALWLLENKYMGLNLELVYWKNNIKQIGEIVLKIVTNKNVEHADIMTMRNLIYEVYINDVHKLNMKEYLCVHINNIVCADVRIA